LAEVVERARNTVQRPARGTPFVQGQGHRARFGEERLYFTPLGGRELPPTLPLTLTVELAAITVGGRPLLVGPAPAQPQVDGNVVRFERKRGVVEEYVARDAGVEQRWWIERDPHLDGELVVAVEVETALELAWAEGGEGFVFRAVDEQGEHTTPVARYGRALALDAGGRAKRAQLWAEEVTPTQPGLRRYRMEMTFAGEWMGDAAYPLLIDPLIGGLLRVDAAHTQPGDQARPAVAYDSTADQHLLVWQDDRNGDDDVYGQFILPGGLLTEENFGITSASGDQIVPDVAYNSDDDVYLVVWISGTQDVEGAIVDAGGNVDTTLELATDDVTRNNPSVTYNPSADRWLVVWQESGGLSGYDVAARTVDDEGNLGTTFTVYDGSGDDTRPDVAASDGEGFLVAWEQARDVGMMTYYTVYARRATVTGVDGAAFAVDTGSNVAPRVIHNPDDDEYLVVWQNLGTSDTIWARRVLEEPDEERQFVDDAFQLDDEGDDGTPGTTERQRDRP
jgi:hypothetical protein